MEKTQGKKRKKLHRESKLQPEELYTLTLTKNQLKALERATEIYARLGISQFASAIGLVHEIKFSTLREIEGLIKNEMGLPLNGGPGISSPSVSEQPQIAWDIYQVIRHRLSWDKAYKDGIIKEGEPRNFKKMFGVSYDTPLKVSKEPLPEVSKKKASEENLVCVPKRYLARD